MAEDKNKTTVLEAKVTIRTIIKYLRSRGLESEAQEIERCLQIQRVAAEQRKKMREETKRRQAERAEAESQTTSEEKIIEVHAEPIINNSPSAAPNYGKLRESEKQTAPLDAIQTASNLLLHRLWETLYETEERVSLSALRDKPDLFFAAAATSQRIQGMQEGCKLLLDLTRAVLWISQRGALDTSQKEIVQKRIEDEIKLLEQINEDIDVKNNHDLSELEKSNHSDNKLLISQLKTLQHHI
ncbi:MAG: hypothetical protein WC251_04425 [Candidatus Izemoplasmatales bacterium]|jgi:hypothetical protein